MAETMESGKKREFDQNFFEEELGGVRDFFRTTHPFHETMALWSDLYDRYVVKYGDEGAARSAADVLYR